MLAADDWTFARQVKGKHQVKYGEAGDCYSSLSCPQGRFSINLQGTAFKVSEATTWAEYGKDPSIRVNRYEVSMGLPRAAADRGDVTDEMLAMLRRAGARWRASAAATAVAAARSRGSSWTSCRPRRGRSRKRGAGECSVFPHRPRTQPISAIVRTRRPISVLGNSLWRAVWDESHLLAAVCSRASRTHARLNALTRVAPAASTRPRPMPARPAQGRLCYDLLGVVRVQTVQTAPRVAGHHPTTSPARPSVDTTLEDSAARRAHLS